MNQFVQDKGATGLSADERAKVCCVFYFILSNVNVMHESEIDVIVVT